MANDDELQEAYNEGFEEGRGDKDGGFFGFGGGERKRQLKDKAYKMGVKDGRKESESSLDSLGYGEDKS